MNEREKPKSSPVDGIMVMMTWHCAICRQNWKSMIDQGTIRRMPSYIKLKGRRVETRRPDGTMIRAHEHCAKRMLKWMEDRGMGVKLSEEQKDTEASARKRIIESAKEDEYK